MEIFLAGVKILQALILWNGVGACYFRQNMVEKRDILAYMRTAIYIRLLIDQDNVHIQAMLVSQGVCM
jgi:hypothetical protein